MTAWHARRQSGELGSVGRPGGAPARRASPAATVLTIGLAIIGLALSGPREPAAAEATAPAESASAAPAVAAIPGPTGEFVEADISARRIDIKADFTGVQVVIFGAIQNSRKETADDGFYDIVVLLEGPRENLVVRQKNRIGAIWINTQSRSYKAVPSYYAIASNRPIEAIARPQLRNWLGLGLDSLKLIPIGTFREGEEIDYRTAIARIKSESGLYRVQNTGVSFVGRSLFRATINLPANVPVGDFKMRVALFHKGVFIDSYSTTLNLERAGVERAIHNFATDQPFLYGVVAVLIAVLAGFGATLLFRKD
ncbi:MAG: TIGR02186 family protein [Rhizobiales bacterium]|nr:TIGR02186 family protein [Hyphomicrobiales bacterium]